MFFINRYLLDSQDRNSGLFESTQLDFGLDFMWLGFICSRILCLITGVYCQE